MTNRDVAAALFISRKTVEANLSRIYGKPASRRVPNSAAAAATGSKRSCSTFGQIVELSTF
jgi:DNA-binding CsgD family transcriptional regulator